jgi:hypothetical protein
MVQHAVDREIVGIGGSRVQDPDGDSVAVRGQQRRAGLIDPHALYPLYASRARNRCGDTPVSPPVASSVLHSCQRRSNSWAMRSVIPSRHVVAEANTRTDAQAGALWIIQDRA